MKLNRKFKKSGLEHKCMPVLFKTFKTPKCRQFIFEYELYIKIYKDKFILFRKNISQSVVFFRSRIYLEHSSNNNNKNNIKRTQLL